MTDYQGPPADYGYGQYPPPAAPYPPRFPEPVGDPIAPAEFGPPPAGFVPVTVATYRPVPARRRGRVTLAVVAIVAVVVAGVAAVLVLGRGSDDSASTSATTTGHTLSVPTAFGDYTQVSDQTALQLADDLRSAMSAHTPAFKQLYSDARIGIFQTPASSRRVVFVGVIWADAPNLPVPDPASAADDVMIGAQVSDATVFPAGSLGGAMRCGTIQGGVPICAWVDGASMGMVVDATSTTPDEAAVTTRALRESAEH